MALRIFLYILSMLFLSLLGFVFVFLIYFLDRKNKLIIPLFSLNVAAIFVALPMFFVVSLVWYINQIKWEKINNKIDDKYLIEKNIDINTNEKQLNISTTKYKYKVIGVFHFINFLPRKFDVFSFEKKKIIVYMNLVLDYGKTFLLNLV